MTILEDLIARVRPVAEGSATGTPDLTAVAEVRQLLALKLNIIRAITGCN
jgi:hypothetical protein